MTILNSSGGKLRGLEEDALADPDLADVVQQRGKEELLAAQGFEAETVGDGRYVAGDLLGVAAQERVLGFYRLSENADRSQVGGAQFPL